MVEISYNSANVDKQIIRSFKYDILEKIEKVFLIVSFAGVMSERANSEINRCQRELNSKEFKFIILNFNDVTYLNEEILGSIRGLQSAIRKKKATIRVCCLRPEWKKIFFEEDIFHKDEIGEGLDTTVDVIKSKIKQNDLCCNNHL